MCSIFPKEILDLTIELLHPRSILDVGCGTGISLDYFKSKGISVRGLEGSALAISKARNAALIQQHDLNQPIHLGQKFDLVWCFEVAEHIHPRYASALLETLTAHGDRILLSAARPGQGGLGHLNEQPRGYWDDLFRGDGYTAVDCLRPRIWQNAEVAWWYRQNLFMFFSAEALQQSPLRASAGRTNDIDLVHVDILNRPSLKRAAAAAIRGLARRIAGRT